MLQNIQITAQDSYINKPITKTSPNLDILLNPMANWSHSNYRGLKGDLVTKNFKEKSLMKRREKILKYIILTLILINVCFFSKMATAHDLWLNMSHHYNEVGGETQLFLGWGHNYPFSDFLDIKRLEKVELINPNGTTTTLHPEAQEPGTKIKVDQEGTYLVAVKTKPGYHTKTPTGYTKKSKRKSDNVIHSTWSEKYAKAIFAGGDAAGESYKKEIGHTIEIIALDDPGMLDEGDILPVKIFFKGKPLPKSFVYGTYVGFSTDRAFAYTTSTDNNGIANIKITKSGVWQIMAMQIHPSPDLKECDDFKYVSFLTFEVK